MVGRTNTHAASVAIPQRTILVGWLDENASHYHTGAQADMAVLQCTTRVRAGKVGWLII